MPRKGGASFTTTRMPRYVEPHTTYTTRSAATTSPAAAGALGSPVEAGAVVVTRPSSGTAWARRTLISVLLLHCDGKAGEPRLEVGGVVVRNAEAREVLRGGVRPVVGECDLGALLLVLDGSQLEPPRPPGRIAAHRNDVPADQTVVLERVDVVLGLVGHRLGTVPGDHVHPEDLAL